LERGLRFTDEAISAMSEETADIPLVQQHQEQLSDYKRDLAILYDSLVELDPGEEDELLTLHSRLEEALFGCSHKVKQLINATPKLLQLVKESSSRS